MIVRGKEEDLENTKKVVVEFERRINTEVRSQKKLNTIEEKDFIKGELLRKYMVRMLYR